jgi:hypothetical protein
MLLTPVSRGLRSGVSSRYGKDLIDWVFFVLDNLPYTCASSTGPSLPPFQVTEAYISFHNLDPLIPTPFVCGHHSRRSIGTDSRQGRTITTIMTFPG